MTSNTTNTTTKTEKAKTQEKTFSELFAQFQVILAQLIYSTFGKTGKCQSKESMEKFAQDVEAAATSLCEEITITIPPTTREETEQQLRTSSLLVPILMTYFLGQKPTAGINAKAFVAEDQPITLVGSGGDSQSPKLIKFCNSRLDSGDIFLRAGDCQGETYLLPGAGVFKPEMTKMPTARLRKGFVGSEHLREIAAFRVDQAFGGFARVPPTAPVTLFADLLPDRDDDSADLVSGSLQKWANSVCASEDMGSSRFNMRDIHRIGILDILLYNTDRHGGNMLVEKSLTCGASCGKGSNRLVPIDHGLCLPDFRHLDQSEFEWLYWRQAQQALSKKDLELIASFDGDKVAGILRGLGLPSGAVLTARIMVAVLHQTAVRRGWNLRQIGKFCSTDFNAKSSPLAGVVASTLSVAGFNDREVLFEDHALFIDSFGAKLEQHLEGKVSV